MQEVDESAINVFDQRWHPLLHRTPIYTSDCKEKDDKNVLGYTQNVDGRDVVVICDSGVGNLTVLEHEFFHVITDNGGFHIDRFYSLTQRWMRGLDKLNPAKNCIQGLYIIKDGKFIYDPKKAYYKQREGDEEIAYLGACITSATGSRQRELVRRVPDEILHLYKGVIREEILDLDE